MGGHDRCAVGPCDNDKRFPGKMIHRGHVQKMVFHKLPKDEKLMDVWVKQISKGRINFVPGAGTRVCSNHFEDGKPTYRKPIPTLFLTPSGTTKKSPRQRPALRQLVLPPVQEPAEDVEMEDEESDTDIFKLTLCTASEQITKDADIRFYTGFRNSLELSLIFDLLVVKAKHMRYWKGQIQTAKETPSRYLSVTDGGQDSHANRPGPDRKLTLEQEFLMVLMRLRTGLLVADLAFRFKVSHSTVSSIFNTWIKLMRRELGWMIIWPSKLTIQENLPQCFRNTYPKVRCTIDCTEFFIESPSALEVQAQCWSDYKHHSTLKCLIGITPTGCISYVSPCYSGRATDQYIVRDSGFLNMIEPYDEILADRGFDIKDDLTRIQARLAIPPRTKAKRPLTEAQVRATSQVANVRIYVEQAIRRIKVYRILGNELPLSLSPLVDDIVIVCSALTNMDEPLCN